VLCGSGVQSPYCFVQSKNSRVSGVVRVHAREAMPHVRWRQTARGGSERAFIELPLLCFANYGLCLFLLPSTRAIAFCDSTYSCGFSEINDSSVHTASQPSGAFSGTLPMSRVGIYGGRLWSAMTPQNLHSKQPGGDWLLISG
jgi:hypothetical protein